MSADQVNYDGAVQFVAATVRANPGLHSWTDGAIALISTLFGVPVSRVRIHVLRLLVAKED